MTLTSQPRETRVVLEKVSWSTYEALLAETGSRRGRLSYEEGTLEILSPSFEHEALKSAIGSLLETFAQVLGIDMTASGSTTLKREMRRRGAEPDESYYVQNEARVRGKTTIDLERDPPPDLVLEIQISRSALDKLGIYAAMGVPEVWMWEGDALVVYWLGDDERYELHETSRALPDLPMAELKRAVSRTNELSTTRLASEFRTWVSENVRRGE